MSSPAPVSEDAGPKQQQPSLFKSFKRRLSRPSGSSLTPATAPPPPKHQQTPSSSSSSPPQPAITPPPATDSSEDEHKDDNDSLHDCSFKVAVSEDYNLKYRQSMEDTHVYIYNFCDVPDAGYFAVFDGHAGAQAAKWCSEHLHALIRLWILRNEGLLPFPPQLAQPEKKKAVDDDAPPAKSPKDDKKSKWFSSSSSSSSASSSSTIKSLFRTGPSPLIQQQQPLYASSPRQKTSSMSLHSAASSSSSVSSSSSSLSPGAAMIPRPNIPRRQIVPRALNAAFLEADARMAEVVPASSGTTVALAVIRWETHDADPPSPPPGPAGADAASDLDSTLPPPPQQPQVESVGAAKAPANCCIPEEDEEKKEGGQDDASVKTVEEAPAETKPAETAEPVKEAVVEAVVEPASEPAETETPSNDLTTSAPPAGPRLTKVATNKSTVSRKSFNHSVVARNRARVLYTANVGDARVVLCRGGRAHRLSYDHKGSDAAEAARVTAAGGLMIANRVNGMLAVTRALGDRYMKTLVSGAPYTTRTVLGPEDEFAIVACDGLWDVCTDQQAVDLVRNVMDPKEATRVLVRRAIDLYSSDNITCMVIRLDPTVCE